MSQRRTALLYRLAIVGALVALVSTACFPTTTTEHYVESAPDVITRDSLKNSVHVSPSRPIAETGKILSASKTLFVNRPYVGWHIIDNTTPSAPRNVGFIAAPGSLDGVVIGNTLYLENSVDLVVLSLANETAPMVLKRLENVLPIPSSPHAFSGAYPADQIVVGWHDTTITVTN